MARARKESRKETGLSREDFSMNALKWIGLFAMLGLGANGFAQAGDAGVVVSSGTDAGSGIAYTFVSLAGKRIGAATADSGAPRLTAQCTRAADGKMRFELLADTGDVAELKYVPPWKATKENPDRPSLGQPTVKMEFLGYTKMKPMKRQWIGIKGLMGEWQYATPGFRSPNLEDETVILRYILALPTMRLTLPSITGTGDVVVEFATGDWLKRVKGEAMCAGAGL
jgi:hypothetical protein